MPGTSMCAQPKSAASTMSCRMVKLCPSARTIRCTGPGICQSIAVSNHESPSFSITLARPGRLSCAAGLHQRTALQHSNTGLLREADHLVCTAAQAVRASIQPGRQCDGCPAGSCDALLHLYGHTAVPGHAGD